MRLFIGSFATIDRYQDIKDSFEGLKASWVPSEKLHLTYAFFSNEEEPKPLIKCVDDTPWQHEDVVIKGLGHFDHKILYAKVEAKSVYRNFELLANIFDLPDFRPHVTLARIQECDPDLLERLIQGFDERPLGRVDAAVHLFQSIQERQGTRYTVLR